MRAFNSSVSLPCSSNGGENGLLAGNQLAEVEQLLFDGADLDLVQVAGRLLAVASDERDRGAFVEELHGGQQALHGHRSRGGVNQEIGRKRLKFRHGQPRPFYLGRTGYGKK